MRTYPIDHTAVVNTVQESLAEAMRAMRGCDGWVTQADRAYFCAEVPAPYVDEETDEAFCANHAGPLTMAADGRSEG